MSFMSSNPLYRPVQTCPYWQKYVCCHIKMEKKRKQAKCLSSAFAPSSDVAIPWRPNPPTHYLKSILECFPLLDLHEADLSGPVCEPVMICQVLHSSSQCMLDTPFAVTIQTHTQIDIPKLNHKHTVYLTYYCIATKIHFAALQKPKC